MDLSWMKVLFHKANIARVVNVSIFTLTNSQREFALGVRRREIKDAVRLGKLIRSCM